MKIIFLDIDGVLNNMAFYEKTQMKEGPFDKKSVKALKKIVEGSGAKIVLTSSWRGGWDRDPEKCQEEGRLLNEMFDGENLKILDKTDCFDISDGTARCKEIKSWMKKCPEKIENFVIIDDADFSWKKNGLYDHWVQTDFMKEGLSSEHIKPALSILLKEKKFPFSCPFLKFFCR